MNTPRDTLLRAAAAIWGFAIAMALLPLWLGPPPAGQLPGFSTSIGLDARAPMRFVLSLILIPLVWTLVLRPFLALLTRDDTRRWSRNAFVVASVSILWFVVINRDIVWVLIAPAIVLAICVVFRRLDAQFSRHDLILLPVLATVYLALLDLLPRSVEQVLLLAGLAVFIVRIAVSAMRKERALPPALVFALAPLGLALQSSFNSYDVRHSPWAPLILSLLSPLLLRGLLRDSVAARLRIRTTLRYVIYPLAAYAYLSATSQLAAEGMPRADLFEDQQHMVPAAEMLRGETPYRDIIPAHGFVQDALLDYIAFRTGPVTLGHALKFRGVISGTIVMAHYALVVAATGSPEVGLASTFLAMLLGTAGGSFRLLPAIATLALIACAVRRRDSRWFAAAGVGVVLCLLTSLDQGAYLLLTILIAALRSGDRKRALLFAAAGGGGAAAVAFALMAIRGFAVDFVRVTLTEIATLGPVYTLSAFDAPVALQRMSNVPEVLASIFDKSAFLYVFWPLMLLGVTLTLTSRAVVAQRRRAHHEAFLIIGIFGVITAISYAERHHLLWLFVAAPLISISIFRLAHSRTPFANWLAGVLVVLALMIGQPTAHIAIAGSLRRTHGPLENGVELSLPRGRGAFSKPGDAAVVDIVQRYAQEHLKPGETWFDFTNRGNLYFLLDRDCPMRQLEVAFYETAERQQDVIRRIEQNPRIRFALMPGDPADTTAVDAVPNRDRAPLVCAYLRQHFVADHSEGDVNIWKRK